MKSKLWLGVLALVLAAGGTALTALYANGNSNADDVADDQVPAADAAAPDPAAITRGAYVAVQGDCAACHTKPGGNAYAGGYGLQTPFGVIYSTNITPERDTGIGTWTERDFFRAVRHGKRQDGALLYPAMPYNAYVKMNDADLHDLWAYIRSLKPVAQAPTPNTLGFPYNIRLAMLGWNLLYFKNAPYVAEPGQPAQWNRGRYLVDGAGHCGACHTPKDALGGDTSAYLQGAELLGGYAPEITGNPHVGVGSWSIEQVAQYLKVGSNHMAVAAGAMGEAVEHSTQYLNGPDLAAIAVYLESLPGSGAQAPAAISANDPAMLRGAHIYETQCMACHNVQGQGIDGMVTGFADNPGIRALSPSNLISTVLKGGRAAVTEGNVTGAGMPSFAWRLDDADIAAVLTYVRNSWGNAAPAVGSPLVSKARAAVHAEPVLDKQR
ncbi:c-type cytochrome [Pseudomonas typographi]|uniref:Cytochrome c n=1 Tax=Pseudomonas typographi TaxID=2715964 RepID=A0ABR7Z9J1_9PSED|nr:cytochrome c [Pseudomonas typographi]MBD1551099.1 cytochrome c [Pseudomonas typographi]MBD1586407.1 cytochrome c [Pseudomonas typographi]MBD1602224.1 cytochrome c [Pseudomonas typographi]